MANFAQLTSNSGFWGSHMSTLMPWGPFIKIQHFNFSYSWTFFWNWSQCDMYFIRNLFDEIFVS